MKLLITQFSPLFCHFLPLRSKYSPQRPVLKHLQSTRAVCKVRGLVLLLQVGTLWRCSDGLFFEVPPLARDALLTTLQPLFENGVTVVLKEHFLGWRRRTLVERQRCAIEKWQ
jgi:hypothetical protein